MSADKCHKIALDHIRFYTCLYYSTLVYKSLPSAASDNIKTLLQSQFDPKKKEQIRTAAFPFFCLCLFTSL